MTHSTLHTEKDKLFAKEVIPLTILGEDEKFALLTTSSKLEKELGWPRPYTTYPVDCGIPKVDMSDEGRYHLYGSQAEGNE